MGRRRGRKKREGAEACPLQAQGGSGCPCVPAHTPTLKPRSSERGLRTQPFSKCWGRDREDADSSPLMELTCEWGVPREHSELVMQQMGFSVYHRVRNRDEAGLHTDEIGHHTASQQLPLFTDWANAY